MVTSEHFQFKIPICISVCLCARVQMPSKIHDLQTSGVHAPLQDTEILYFSHSAFSMNNLVLVNKPRNWWCNQLYLLGTIVQTEARVGIDRVRPSGHKKVDWAVSLFYYPSCCWKWDSRPGTASQCQLVNVSHVWRAICSNYRIDL